MQAADAHVHVPRRAQTEQARVEILDPHGVLIDCFAAENADTARDIAVLYGAHGLRSLASNAIMLAARPPPGRYALWSATAPRPEVTLAPREPEAAPPRPEVAPAPPPPREPEAAREPDAVLRLAPRQPEVAPLGPLEVAAPREPEALRKRTRRASQKPRQSRVQRKKRAPPASVCAAPVTPAPEARPAVFLAYDPEQARQRAHITCIFRGEWGATRRRAAYRALFAQGDREQDLERMCHAVMEVAPAAILKHMSAAEAHAAIDAWYQQQVQRRSSEPDSHKSHDDLWTQGGSCSACHAPMPQHSDTPCLWHAYKRLAAQCSATCAGRTHFSQSLDPAAYELPLRAPMLSAALVLVHHGLLRADLLMPLVLHEERYEPHAFLAVLLVRCEDEALAVRCARHLASLCRVPARDCTQQ